MSEVKVKVAIEVEVEAPTAAEKTERRERYIAPARRWESTDRVVVEEDGDMLWAK
jgi:hypothetical protein